MGEAGIPSSFPLCFVSSVDAELTHITNGIEYWAIRKCRQDGQTGEIYTECIILQRNPDGPPIEDILRRTYGAGDGVKINIEYGERTWREPK